MSYYPQLFELCCVKNIVVIYPYLLHIGLYAYRVKTLSQITKLDQTPLEKSEKLEQLHWLENGYKIKVATTNHPNIGIDTPNDLELLNRTI